MFWYWGRMLHEEDMCSETDATVIAIKFSVAKMAVEDLDFYASWTRKLDTVTAKILQDTLAEHPHLKPLFSSVARCLLESETRSSTSTGAGVEVLKKRKLEDTTSPAKTTTSTQMPSSQNKEWGELRYVLGDVSFSTPRKKFDLFIFQYALILASSAPNSTGQTLDASYNGVFGDGKKRVVELLVTRAELKCVLCLPTAKKTHHETIVLWKKASVGGDEIVFGLPTSDAPEKAKTSTFIDCSSVTAKDGEKATSAVLATLFAGERIIKPLATDFKSMYPQTHASTAAKRQEQQLYVDCYLGSKEGQLYFMPTGVLFGVKKPIMFVEFGEIKAVEIVNITTRHFTIMLEYFSRGGDGTKTEKKEFGMVEYCEFQPIMDYVKKYRLDQMKIAGLSMEQVDRGDYQKPGQVTVAGDDKKNIEGSVGVVGGGGGETEDESTDEDYETGSSSSEDETSDEDDSDGDSQSDDGSEEIKGSSGSELECEESDVISTDIEEE